MTVSCQLGDLAQGPEA